MNEIYDDIIDLPHHVSPTRPRMSMRDRAAQFAPFSALTGYDDTVAEVERLTEKRVLLDEYQLEVIDREINYLLENIEKDLTVYISYFAPDSKKDGGRYIDKKGVVSEVNEYERSITFDDGTKVQIDDILSLRVEKNKDVIYDRD